MAAAASDILPAIRAELRLVGRRREVSGAEVSVIYDPLRHRFFEIGPLASEMLLRWRGGSRTTLVEQINAATPHRASLDDVDTLVQFLGGNQLLRGAPKAPRAAGFARVEHAIGRIFFFRIPLLHPDRAMGVLSEMAGPLLGRTALMALAALAFAGLMLVVRQWDLFVAAFRPVFNVGGAMSLFAAIVLAKAVHEVGHALAAKRMGCSVPAMGVAVVFGAPLLYTDLSDSWRLSRRRDRLLVAAGGILAETALAALATWGWLILPDGPVRGACFFLATAAWIATLLVNINPFMRFDGYFMLSDVLGVPNLQERAFALGRWTLRRLLWDSPEARPDDAPRGLGAALIAYAWSTWLFRGGLYFGLAVTAFHLLPKVLAVPILAAELWVLVFRPVVHELANWWKGRKVLLGTPRGRMTGFLLVALVAWLAVPQSFQLALPAVLVPAERQWINPPRAAQLVSHLGNGTTVAAGDALVVFRDPELDHQVAQGRLRLDMLHASMDQAARNQRAARDLAVLGERIASETATVSGLEAQREALTVRAPFAGRVREVSAGLVDGAWYAPADLLFMLISQSGATIIAFVDDRNLDLAVPGGSATFHPAAVDFPVLAALVTAVEVVPSEFITEPMLASLSGGAIPTEADSAGRAVPRQGQYRISARPLGTGPLGSPAVEGKLMVDSRPHSLLGLALRRLQAVVVREAGA